MDLAQAVHQQAGLDLFGDFLAETVLDEFPRGVAGPKTGHLRSRHQLAVFPVGIPVNVFPGDRHRHVPFARASVVDLNFKSQPGFRFAFRPLDALVGNDFLRFQGLAQILVPRISHDGTPSKLA